MNIGTATSTLVVPTFHAIMPVISHSGRSLKPAIRPRAMMPSTAATGTPMKYSTTSATTTIERTSTGQEPGSPRSCATRPVRATSARKL